MTSDRREAAHLARQLEEDNRLRRKLADDVVRSVQDERAACDGAAALIAASEAWNPAVLGIAAARLLDDETRPVGLVAWRGTEGKGSARAPAGMDVHAALRLCKDMLVEFGGHSRAAGFTVRRDRFGAFRERFLGCLASNAPASARAKRLTVEGALPL